MSKIMSSKIKKYQTKYYDSIAICNNNGNFTVFVEFMLKMIYEELDEISSDNI